ncbi:hypothetical protein Pogu_1820 [Pyrobaculum oguniense TE7]|uniref:Uncharacterized protein n=1 Tax=Pyrobaculum oguniense (strain DSM 13380 / JCM 10595 / TE7) TaxID=698757 RepID=H6Q9H9_PYROT|nr:hypothetical protein Pogu_1820 [Pyrobaculum oguniense TE7]
MRLIPREWTITGVLTTNLAVALSLGLPAEPWRVALAAVAFFVHLTTFSPLFETASRRAVHWPLVALNGAVYIPILWSVELPILTYLFALSAVVLLVASHGRLRTAYGYVAGLALYASLVIPMRYLLGRPDAAELYGLALYVAYFVAYALYVESRLAFRNVDCAVPLLFWAPAAGFLVGTNPLLAVPAAEPTASLLQNYRRCQKVGDLESIKKMGKSILLRSLLFTALLIAAVRLGSTRPFAMS